jgi:hypothetical protein
MDSFYQDLSKLSKENTHKRLEKEKQNQISHFMKIKNAMACLFTQITETSNLKELMQEAATNGYNKFELYSFEKGAECNDLPLIFLTRGPQNYNGFGLKYFEEANINPYIKQLQQYYSPFNVYYTSNHKTGKTSIMISW